MSETNTPHVLDTLGRAQELVKRLLDAVLHQGFVHDR